jgi:hypothetical protein
LTPGRLDPAVPDPSSLAARHWEKQDTELPPAARPYANPQFCTLRTLTSSLGLRI